MDGEDSKDPQNSTQRESSPVGMRSCWLVGGLSLLAAIAILPFDATLAEPDNIAQWPGDLKRFITLSEVFAHGCGLVFVSAGVWLLAQSKRRFIPRIILCAVWPSLGVHLIKLFFGRFRPIKYFDELSQTNFPASPSETWLGWMPRDELNVTYHCQSFPSAHAAAVWGLAIGMSWVFPKGKWLFYSLAVLSLIHI